MKKSLIITIIVSSILLLILLSIYAKADDSPGEYDGFASCLTQSGLKMYGTEWCSHCKDQKKMFGNSFDYIDYIDCDSNKDACLSAGVKGYPTWKLNSASYPGTRQLSQLSQISGCELIKDVK